MREKLIFWLRHGSFMLLIPSCDWFVQTDIVVLNCDVCCSFPLTDMLGKFAGLKFFEAWMLSCVSFYVVPYS